MERDGGPAGFRGGPELSGDDVVLGGTGGDSPEFTVTIATVNEPIS